MGRCESVEKIELRMELAARLLFLDIPCVEESPLSESLLSSSGIGPSGKAHA